MKDYFINKQTIRLKKNYCNNNNIKLIEIQYNDLYNIDNNYLLSLINNTAKGDKNE